MQNGWDEKISRRANFLQPKLNVASCVFSLLLAKQRPFLRGWDAVKDVFRGKWQGRKKFAPRELFTAQIKRGNLCVFTVFGQATANFAWLGRRKRRVTWEMAEIKKVRAERIFCSPT